MDVRAVEHLWIPLPDGTRLAAALWLPADAERRPVPALLEYLPYRKRDGTAERDSLTHPWLAAHGYACLRVDIRGTGESEGLLSDEYSAQELADGVALIAWIAAQPWCSGAVGMFGISWGGFNALQIAALRPPALKAVVTLCSTDDRYATDVHYLGGAKLEAGFGWASFFFADMTHPPDPLLVGERWRDMWLERLENLTPFLDRWLEHPRRDAYWRHGSVCEDWAAIACPVYAVGGWTDGYTNAIPRLLANLRVPRKGLIGPWAHAYPHFARPGPQIGFLQECLRWWDHWLKGRDSGIMAEPMLRAWMTDSHRPAAHHETLPGRWVGEPAWPPARPPRRLHLSALGLVEKPTVMVRREVSSPLTIDRHAGEWCPFGRGNDQADDQREDDAQSLSFETEPLAAPLELLGAPGLELKLASDKPVAQVIARLCDVHPDGASLRLSYGVLNLTHRDSHAEPQALEPGRRYRVRVPLDDCGCVVPAGHRLRLALSTSYWPMVWPAPETATLTIVAGALDLPVRPPRAETLPDLPPVETAPPQRPRTAGKGVVVWDQLAGLEVGSQSHYERTIGDDPASAAVAMRRTLTVARGAWRTRVETTMCLGSTREAFRLQATLRAFDGDEEVCRRDWDKTIRRDLA